MKACILISLTVSTLLTLFTANALVATTKEVEKTGTLLIAPAVGIRELVAAEERRAATATDEIIVEVTQAPGDEEEEEEEEQANTINPRLSKVVRLLELFVALMHLDDLEEAESEAAFKKPLV